jgi:hypothetical protein
MGEAMDSKMRTRTSGGRLSIAASVCILTFGLMNDKVWKHFLWGWAQVFIVIMCYCYRAYGGSTKFLPNRPGDYLHYEWREPRTLFNTPSYSQVYNMIWPETYFIMHLQMVLSYMCDLKLCPSGLHIAFHLPPCVRAFPGLYSTCSFLLFLCQLGPSFTRL